MKAGLGSDMDMGPDLEAESGRTPFVAPTVEEVGRLFPQLEILGFLGQGGMGAVYRARQRELDRVVALKILPPGIGKEAAFAERFTREAKALAKLNHPGIVTLYEFGKADGLFFFLMEFVDGVNLRRLLEGGRLSSCEALAIVPQICDALQYAHDRGIVHRDIKPDNILMDRQGRVKVADFGLAKLVGRGDEAGSDAVGSSVTAPLLTEAGKVMGTPQYMAPEQMQRPREVDHRADIYSLGVVFYQMLTGELPGRPIEPPSRKVQVDVRLDEVVLRALEKEPQRRYRQVSEVKSDLEEIVRVPPLLPEEADASSPLSARRRAVKRGTLVAAVVAGLAFIAALLAWRRLGDNPEPKSLPQFASDSGTAVERWTEPIPKPTEFMQFPADSGVVNVKSPPYNAKGDGVTDDTRAIQQALDDHPNQHAIIYLPNGVYLVGDTLQWKRGHDATLQGTSRNATILRLRDACPRFSDVKAPRPVLCTGPNDKERYRNSIRYLTVYTGRNNPGATGIQLNSRQGCVRHVLIRSGDGQGAVGLDMSFGEETGPTFVKNVTVSGFNVGVSTKNVLRSQTFEHLTLEDQRQVGLLNDGQILSIRDLKSRGQVSAIRSTSPVGLIVLVDSQLEADADVPFAAIENRAGLFLRNVTVKRFSLAVKQTGAEPVELPGGLITEWASRPMPGSKVSLNLPVKETPPLSWDPTNEWVNVLAFRTDPGSRDISDALQRAIDSGKTTVYFPRGNYVIAKPVELRGQVSRMIGCEAVLQVRPQDERQAALTLGAGDAPAVAIERLIVDFPGSVLERRFIDNPSGRTLLLRDCQGVDSKFTGPGEIFLEGVDGRMIFHGQKVWARQINQTSLGSSPPDRWWHLRNEGGVMWVLGEESGGPGPVVSTTRGGQTEVLGGLLYSSGGADEQLQPAFVVEDGRISVSVGEVSFTNGVAYPVLVRHTRKGESRDVLLPAQSPGGVGASLIPLFSSE